MTITMLIDLDDTLLGNNMDTFIPEYFGRLSNHLSALVKPELLLPALLTATREMTQNLEINRTLQETFNHSFFPSLTLDKEKMALLIDEFYKSQFPKLKAITKVIPASKSLIEKCIQREYPVGIATNPLFPRTAIIQRLQWAGLDPSSFPFALIPSYEDFHFAKPNPAFFAEFLARLGFPDQPAIMIGNDKYYDIDSARSFGIPAFWVAQSSEHVSNPPDAGTGVGTLDDIITWVDDLDEHILAPQFHSRKSIEALLAGIPAAISTIYQNIAQSQWHLHPLGDNEWGLLEIICHLRDVDSEVNLPRIIKITSEKNPFIPPKDTDQWAEQRNYSKEDGILALKSYLETRQSLLNLLRSLSGDDWQRQATHALFGPTNLQEILYIITQHDILHIRQIHSVINYLPH